MEETTLREVLIVVLASILIYAIARFLFLEILASAMRRASKIWHEEKFRAMANLEVKEHPEAKAHG